MVYSPRQYEPGLLIVSPRVGEDGTSSRTLILLVARQRGPIWHITKNPRFYVTRMVLDTE